MSNKENSKQSLQPRLRFPEFRDAGNWEERTLQEFLKESRIAGSPGDVAKKITVKLWGKGVYEKEEVLKGSENTQYYRRRSGQFIYSKLDFLNQAFGVIPDYLDGFESTVDLPCFDISPKLNPTYLLEYVKRKDFYKKFGEIADGGRKAKRIQVDTFLSFPIIIPPSISKTQEPLEQKKIADCLSSLDALIKGEEQKLENLQEYKKGLMNQLFPAEGETIPKLRFPEFGDALEWERCLLGSKTSKVGSGTTPNGGEKNYTSTGRPFIRSQNVGWGELLLEDVAFINDKTHSKFSATEIKNQDVLLNITGASIGRSAVADKRIEGGNVNQHVCIIRVKSSELLPKLLSQYLLSEHGQKQIDGFQAGGNRQGLNFAQVRSFSIPLPPNIKEQQKIADILSSIDGIITTQSQKIDVLKDHKKGLMQQLIPAVAEVRQ